MSVSTVQRNTRSTLSTSKVSAPDTSKANAAKPSAAKPSAAKPSVAKPSAPKANALQVSAPKASAPGASRAAPQKSLPASRDEFVPGPAQRSLSLPGLGLVQGLINKGLDLVSKGDSIGVGLIRDELNTLLGPGSTGQPGWMQRDSSLPPTHDVTSDFRQVYANAAAGKDTLPPDANKYVYLTIRGLTGNHWPGYMEPTRDALAAKGLDVREIPIGTEDSTMTNAAKIRDAILNASKDGKQVVLIGHSKGGVDATAALALYPEMKDHVRAVVAMQSPYGGAPLATDLRSNPLTKDAVGFLAQDVLGGTPNSVRDLTYQYRQDFIQSHPYPTDIPTLSLATSTDSQLSALAGPADYTRLRYGADSDGLVVAKDAMIPGSNVVHLTDLDHMQSIEPTLPGDHYDPGALSVALVSMALQMPQPNALQNAA